MKEESGLFSMDYTELGIASIELEKMMGYTQSGDAPGPVTDIISEVTKWAPELCDIRGGYRILGGATADKSSRTVTIGETIFNTAQIVTHQLRNMESAALFVCTMGQPISARIASLMQEGDLLKGYVLDVLANIAVDLAMDRIQEHLAKQMEQKEWCITNRYSPGYCGWDVTEQKKLFSLLPEGFAGVKLTDSALMIPIKSVSGMIGLGREVKFNNYTCNLCNQQECLYRNRNAKL